MNGSSYSNSAFANWFPAGLSVPARLLLLGFPLLLAACAGNPHQARSTDYYRDAQLCRGQNPVQPPAGSGRHEPSTMDRASGVDTEGYLQCMERLGYRQDTETDPLLKALAVCRQQAEGPAAMTSSGNHKRGRGMDSAVFQACLKQRGVQGEVEVGTLPPAGPQRP